MQPHGAPTWPPPVPFEMPMKPASSVPPSGVMMPPVMRQPIRTEVVLVVLDVEVLVLLEVLELVELLVLLEVEELLELEELVDVLVDVLVVVVWISVPSCLSERNGWSVVASCSAPCVRSSSAPVWSPARTSATASVTPGFTFIV